MYTLFDRILHVVLALVVVLAAGTWSWWMVEAVPLTWESKVWVFDAWGEERHSFLPGEEAFFERAYCQRKAVSAKVLRRFVNMETKLVHELEALQVWRGYGCFQTRFGVTVPRIPPGRYRFETDAYMDTNPIRVDYVQLPSTELTVLPDAEWQKPPRR